MGPLFLQFSTSQMVPHSRSDVIFTGCIFGVILAYCAPLTRCSLARVEETSVLTSSPATRAHMWWFGLSGDTHHSE